MLPMPRRAVCLSVLAWACAWSWGMAGTALAQGSGYGSARAVVVRVCDGDTVVVDIPGYPDIIGKQIRVRLAGVDAPELRSRDPGQRRAAAQARRDMEMLLPPGTPVTLHDIRRDKYFRLDAAIRLDDRDVAAALGLLPRP